MIQRPNVRMAAASTGRPIALVIAVIASAAALANRNQANMLLVAAVAATDPPVAATAPPTVPAAVSALRGVPPMYVSPKPASVAAPIPSAVPAAVSRENIAIRAEINASGTANANSSHPTAAVSPAGSQSSC